ncbi:hypothetical protein [Nonomuraea sp. NPDC046570]
MSAVVLHAFGPAENLTAGRPGLAQPGDAVQHELGEEGVEVSSYVLSS